MALFKRKKHSLSAKLVLLFIVMALVLLVLVGGSMRFAFRSNFKENIKPHLFRYMEYIQQDIGTPPDFNRAQEIVKDLPVEIHLFDQDRQWSSTETPLDLEGIHYYKRFSKNGVDYTLGEFEDRDYLVRKHQDYTLAFSVPHSRPSWTWHKAIPLAIALVLLVILYRATRRIFAPIKAIKDGVELIGEGNLSQRIEINRRDELGDLSNSINKMADDIQQMLEAKRQLLLAISHELRSPMTRVKVSLEMVNDKKTREEINHDLSEMDNLITELLETERLTTRHSALNKSEVSLTGLVQEVVDEYFKGKALETNLLDPEFFASVDAVRIKILLKNLLDNAIKHNPDGANPTRLTLNKTDDAIVISVEDFGKGIEEKHIPFLTEPFYRVDPARQRQTGGYGLGLYLCRIIAEAHGGKLNIFSEVHTGTRVEANLPIKNADK
ncbi:MAG: HAMP domain-containing histidine kinase [Candidatus Nitronauta litoralis]|uniref:histidine kinase n=1 Tax=Candidatus Nitronauta litoralis TaxID=2705533 RepID=A0A7T0BVZ2_9BACT|nr:MAG: HAMP domain-containing histidine kinase [Candidatus Nitronauta litoralis]